MKETKAVAGSRTWTRDGGLSSEPVVTLRQDHGQDHGWHPTALTVAMPRKSGQGG